MTNNTVLTVDEVPRCAIALMGSKNGQFLPSGSASLISQTLAVTAAHVIRDYEERYGKEYKLVGAIAKGTTQQVADAAGTVLGEHAISIVRSVKQTAVVTPGDLALVEFSAAFPSEATPATIRLRPPKVKEEVAGFGFVQGKATPMDEQATEIFWRHAAWMGAGQVSKLYLRGRDQRLPWPAFEAVGIDWRSGTSGGPILDSHGRLLAVVSTGISAYQNEPPVSFGSVIWPIIGAVDLLRLTLKDNQVCQGMSECSFDGLEHMRVDKQPSGIYYTTYNGPGAE